MVNQRFAQFPQGLCAAGGKSLFTLSFVVFGFEISQTLHSRQQLILQNTSFA
jgi:hypothetical protein